jgi:hypothetical protein
MKEDNRMAELFDELLIKQIKGLKDQLLMLLNKSQNVFRTLSEADVPEGIGVYLIYEDKTEHPIYVGMSKENKPKLREPTGLRFRIMRNHLGRRGTDNFLGYLAEELRGDRSSAVDYVRNHCSCCWLELNSPREAMLLEHFSIAVLDPRFNRS